MSEPTCDEAVNALLATLIEHPFTAKQINAAFAKMGYHRAPASPQQEAGEPVARMHPDDGRVIPESTYATGARDGGSSWSSVRPYTIKLYATPQASPPQARVPLTYVDLRRIANQCGLGANEMSAQWQVKVDGFARAIERAHLIGLETDHG